MYVQYSFFLRMAERGVSSLEDVYSPNDAKVHQVLGNDFARWARGRQMLPSTKEALEAFKSSLWRTLVILEENERSTKDVWFRGKRWSGRRKMFTPSVRRNRIHASVHSCRLSAHFFRFFRGHSGVRVQTPVVVGHPT